MKSSLREASKCLQSFFFPTSRNQAAAKNDLIDGSIATLNEFGNAGCIHSIPLPLAPWFVVLNYRYCVPLDLHLVNLIRVFLRHSYGKGSGSIDTDEDGRERERERLGNTYVHMFRNEYGRERTI